MKCSDVKGFFAQVSDGTVTMPMNPNDLTYLSSGGYLTLMQKADYDSAEAEVANLAQINQDLQAEYQKASADGAAYGRDQRKTHSFLFHFEGKDKKQADLQREESERQTYASDQAEIAQKDSAIAALVQKKSTLDRLVPYDGEYVALTGLGVITLNDLNIRNYRVADTEFSDFVAETKETSGELGAIAARANSFVSEFRTAINNADLSQLWSVAIGLAKIQADQAEVIARFMAAMKALQHFDSTLENKMMAAEIMTSFRAQGVQPSTDNSDIQGLEKTLESLENDVRHQGHVPKQISAAVAAMMLYSRRYDGTYPIDKLVQFSKMTPSYEAAAILAVSNMPSDEVGAKMQSFKYLFNSWGWAESEDVELSSAFLAISELSPDDVKLKLSIITDALKNYLEYPLVCSAILASISTLEANETLDLMEKAYAILATFAVGLDRSELVCLAARMIHGITNELVRKLDPTAKITNTPVQFTHGPGFFFFPFYSPLILAHGSYFATYSGMGGAHPAHVHGVGGFVG